MAKKQTIGEVAGLSLKTILITFVGILLFIMYIGVLFYGENSLIVLNQLTERKEHLVSKEIILKQENQKLQKEFFELKQLENKD